MFWRKLMLVTTVVASGVVFGGSRLKQCALDLVELKVQQNLRRCECLPYEETTYPESQSEPQAA